MKIVARPMSRGDIVVYRSWYGEIYYADDSMRSKVTSSWVGHFAVSLDEHGESPYLTWVREPRWIHYQGERERAERMIKEEVVRLARPHFPET